MDKNTHSTDGREWAKLSDLKAGDLLEFDTTFPAECNLGGKTLLVQKDGASQDDDIWFVACARGRHYLASPVGRRRRRSYDRGVACGGAGMKLTDEVQIPLPSPETTATVAYVIVGFLTYGYVWNRSAIMARWWMGDHYETAPDNVAAFVTAFLSGLFWPIYWVGKLAIWMTAP